MYEGYLAMDGVEVVNTHRAAAYAAAAGLPWVKGCSHCSSVVAGLGGNYVTPLLDANAGDPPPWWDGSIDAAEFFGLIGVSVDNADDSTRRIEVLSGAAGAGHFGSLRYGVRALTVRAIAVAASDCALGFGLEWLRGIDGGQTCESVTTEMYDCCPNVAQSDCDDPTCIDQCIQRRLRLFFGSRITSGPTVLRRRELSARGAMAEVEFVITVTDPSIYSFVPAFAMAVPEAVPWEDPAPVSSPARVDAFASAVAYAAPPSLVPTPRFLPRVSWDRQVVDIPAPEFGSLVTPIVTLESVAEVPSVRLTLSDATGRTVGQWWMEGFPTGGKVTLDFRARRVTTESNGISRRNDSFVMDPSGGPARWPVDLPKMGYSLAVDRAPGSDPLTVEVTMMGRVNP